MIRTIVNSNVQLVLDIGLDGAASWPKCRIDRYFEDK